MKHLGDRWYEVELEACDPMELLRNVSEIFVRRNTDGLWHGFGTVKLAGPEQALRDFIVTNWDQDQLELLEADGAFK